MKTWMQAVVAVVGVGIALASFVHAADKPKLDLKKASNEKEKALSKEGAKGDGTAVLEHKMKSLAGKTVDLSQYNGKVVLIVNVASHCGYTPQYEELQALNKKYKDKGLAVLGFPCNQFKKQEPGTSEEIATFCKQNYGVTFDMFEKILVNDDKDSGEKAAPLYQQLTSEKFTKKDAGPVKWNFEKFLIGRDGHVVARFRSNVKPESEEMVKAIETELAKK